MAERRVLGEQGESGLSEDRKWDELRLLYEVTIGDIETFKRRQWSVAYYAVVLDAAMIGVHKALSTTPTGAALAETVLLAVFTGLMFSFGLVILIRLQGSIAVRRSRLDKIRSHFGDAFRAAWAARPKSAWDSKRGSADTLLMLIVSLILATGLTEWLLFRM